MKKRFWQECDNSRLEFLLSKTKEVSILKHIQAVYLKSKYNMKAEDIGKIVGFSKGYVWLIHSLYRNKGEAAFVMGNKGGSYHYNLDINQEKQLLEKFIDSSDLGRILEVKAIKRSYEELVGKEVNKSVIYRMLSRHGWRKIATRPVHPKNNQASMEAFKKTLPIWCKMA